jgi:hypothetical protein
MAVERIEKIDDEEQLVGEIKWVLHQRESVRISLLDHLLGFSFMNTFEITFCSLPY